MPHIRIRTAILVGCLSLMTAIATGQQQGAGDPSRVVQLQLKSPEVEAVARRLDAAARAVAEAETDEQRTEAERELREAVAAQFDQIVKQREEQIAELQERLEKLNKQLEERRAARDEIVGLRVKVLINEARGLGFFPGQTNGIGDANPFSPQMLQPINSRFDSLPRPAELPRPRRDPAGSLTPPGGGGSSAPSRSSR